MLIAIHHHPETVLVGLELKQRPPLHQLGQPPRGRLLDQVSVTPIGKNLDRWPGVNRQEHMPQGLSLEVV